MQLARTPDKRTVGVVECRQIGGWRLDWGEHLRDWLLRLPLRALCNGERMHCPLSRAGAQMFAQLCACLVQRFGRMLTACEIAIEGLRRNVCGIVAHAELGAQYPRHALAHEQLRQVRVRVHAICRAAGIQKGEHGATTQARGEIGHRARVEAPGAILEAEHRLAVDHSAVPGEMEPDWFRRRKPVD